MAITKSIFITGGASGIGASTLRLFHARGWRVGFCDIDESAGAGLAEELCGSSFYQVSTCDAAGINAAIGDFAQCTSGLNALFCNAGVHHSGTLMATSDEELRRVVEINLFGTINTLRAAIPWILKSREAPRAIVINASDQSIIGKPHSFAYGLCKGALGQLTKSLALDMAKDGIRVNAVCPGTIRTPLVDAIFQRCHNHDQSRSIDSFWEEEAALFPMQRVGSPEEVARGVYYLIEDATFTTGTLLSIDGGLTAG